MSIPLDRLYHYIEDLAKKTYGNIVNIYRFFPYGSKNINDLNPLKSYPDWFSYATTPQIWCNDQEPLAYEYYAQQSQIRSTHSLLDSIGQPPTINQTKKNLNWSNNIFTKNLLLHSEKRSDDLEKYSLKSDLVPVYYWSHAVIATDWFRYAKHETFFKQPNKCFLIYNRAWDGTREYRIKFADLLIEHKLVDQCLTFFTPTVNGTHYQNYSFTNKTWRPDHVLERYLQPTTVDASASADFCTEDYRSTKIEIVLETLFDDKRLHLTEKSLRPIACRQPFILLATHGSLQYLKDYGFKTFDTVWNESYDNIHDPYTRMSAVISVMQDISNWTESQWKTNEKIMQEIVDHNQKHFFSENFFNLIMSELQTNLRQGFDAVKHSGFANWTDRWRLLLSHSEIKEQLDRNQDPLRPTRAQYSKILEYIKNYSI